MLKYYQFNSLAGGPDEKKYLVEVEAVAKQANTKPPQIDILTELAAVGICFTLENEILKVVSNKPITEDYQSLIRKLMPHLLVYFEEIRGRESL